MLQIVSAEEPVRGQIVASKYRLERVVGEGGMGVVWAATHVLTHKPCALKFIKASRATDPKYHERLLSEARAACKVRHPNVAPVHDILELANGIPFIVMDLLEGESLAARLRSRGRLSLRETLAIAIPIASAVEAAHAAGVVHRDLKPENVFLEREHVFVLDFGIAKEGEKSGAFAPMRTTFSQFGTPDYMAPEQIDALSPTVDDRVDVWALGIVLVECLTGAPPPRNAIGFIKRGALAKGGELAELLGRMLADVPGARPSMTDVRRALERRRSRSIKGILAGLMGLRR